MLSVFNSGTILDDSLLQSKNNNHLLSICFLKGDFSVSWVDMSTGVIKLQKIIGKNTFNDLYELISKVEPEEIIISEGFEKLTYLTPSLINLKKLPLSLQDFLFQKIIKKKLKLFKKSFIDSLGELDAIDLGAVGAVINYLELTQKQNIPLINDFEIVNKDKFMQIDNFSVRSLELFEQTDGQKKGSLLDVIDETKTAAGGRLLRNFIKFPLVNIKEIRWRHNLVSEFLENSMVMTQVINLLSDQPDVERAMSRISAGTNNPRDTILVKNFVENSEKIFSEISLLDETKKNDLLPNPFSIKNATKLKDYILEHIVEVHR